MISEMKARGGIQTIRMTWAVLLGLLPALLARADTVEFSIRYETRFGQSVFVSGDQDNLGRSDLRKAVRLSPHQYPEWKVKINLPVHTLYHYRFFVREDHPQRLADPNNGAAISEEFEGRTGTGPERLPRVPVVAGPSSGIQARVDRMYLQSGAAMDVHRKFMSKILNNERTFRVFVPRQVISGEAKVEHVAYFQDGQNIFDYFWPYQSWDLDHSFPVMMDQRKIPMTLLVGVDFVDRTGEYVPSEHGRDFARAFVEEFIPYIESVYQVNPRGSSDRVGRSVSGSSLGGLISMYLVQAYPQYFGQVFSLSGAFLDGPCVSGSFDSDLKVYLDTGTEGPSFDNCFSSADCRDRILEDPNRVMGGNLFTQTGFGDFHNEKAWRVRFPQAFERVVGSGHFIQ